MTWNFYSAPILYEKDSEAEWRWECNDTTPIRFSQKTFQSYAACLQDAKLQGMPEDAATKIFFEPGPARSK